MNDINRDPEDQKYGGLEVDNAQEAMNYFQIENVVEYVDKREEDLNQRIENDYHNTYYDPQRKVYGTRTLRMSNKEWHKLNTLQDQPFGDN